MRSGQAVPLVFQWEGAGFKQVLDVCVVSSRGCQVKRRGAAMVFGVNFGAAAMQQGAAVDVADLSRQMQ